jgi:transposase
LQPQTRDSTVSVARKSAGVAKNAAAVSGLAELFPGGLRVRGQRLIWYFARNGVLDRTWGGGRSISRFIDSATVSGVDIVTRTMITSVQRRRRWSRAEKERIVAAALGPGVVASEVAREAGIHTSQLFRWRQQLCKRAPAPVAFNPVAVAPVQEAAALPLPAPPPEQAGTVEIEFATGGRMRITGSVDASTVSALVKALAKTKRRR